MEQDFIILAQCPLFSGIQIEDLPAMLQCLQVKIIETEKNEFIFREGTPAKYVGIVLSGSVQIVREDYFGNRSILSVVNPSGIFGEAYSCAETDSLPISVISVQKSRIMLADCKRVMTVCGNSCSFHNQLIYNLLKVVARKNIQLNRKLELMSQKTTREKLMFYLLGEAKVFGSNSFTIPFDRQELADYLGVERSALSAEISRMRKENIILCERSHFTLLTNEKD